MSSSTSFDLILPPLPNNLQAWSPATAHSFDSSEDADGRGIELPSLSIQDVLRHGNEWLSAEEDAEEGEDPFAYASGSGSGSRDQTGRDGEPKDGEEAGYSLTPRPDNPRPSSSSSAQHPHKKFHLPSFLLSLPPLPLPHLAHSLKTYHTQLKSELSQLIEDDYEEFISLGMGLRGEGGRLSGLWAMLRGGRGEVGLKEAVEQIHSHLLSHQTSLTSLLDNRSHLRKERQVTVMLIHLWEVIGRVEGMLGIRCVEDGNLKDNVTGGDIRESGGRGLMEEDEEVDDYEDEEEDGGYEDNHRDQRYPYISTPQIITSAPITTSSKPSSSTPRISIASKTTTQKVNIDVPMLSRISNEYRQLIWLVGKAREEGCAVVVGDESDNSQRGLVVERIDTIQKSLLSLLSNLFTSQLTQLFTRSSDSNQSPAQQQSEQKKLMEEMYEVLKVYDLIEGWREAEGVLEALVEKEVGKVIMLQALTLGPTPGTPSTPYTLRSDNPSSPAVPATPTGSSLTPTTNIFDTSLSAANDSTFTGSRFLDESSGPLAVVYNRVLGLVEKNFVPVMVVGERIRRRGMKKKIPAGAASTALAGLGFANANGSGNGGMGGGGESSLAGSVDSLRNLPQPEGLIEEELEERDGFEFLANVVWKQVGGKIIDELGGAVFAAGRVSSLHQNYTLTHRFLDELENLAPSPHAIHSLRSHPVYEAFEKRWQLPVYFQLRWKEIITELDGVLSSKAGIGSEKGKDGYSLPQTAAIYKSISTCFSPSVYIPELSYRFWRLTLQLLSRYKVWIERAVPVLYDGSTGGSRKSFQIGGGGNSAPASGRNSLSLARSTPNPNAPTLPTGDPASDPASAAAENNILKVSTMIAIDLRKLEREVRGLWDGEIRGLLVSQLGEEGVDEVKTSLNHALSELAILSDSPSTQIISILSRRCTDSLKQIRAIASQLRATPLSKTGNNDPSRRNGQEAQPSRFISGVLKPLKDYYEGMGKELKDSTSQEWSKMVFTEVIASYGAILGPVRDTEALLSRYARGKKFTFSIFSSSSSSASNAAATNEEENRFRNQMVLDIKTLGREARGLGVDVDVDGGDEDESSIPGWKGLLELAEKPLSEG